MESGSPPVEKTSGVLSLVLLRRVAKEFGYQPSDNQLPLLNEAIVDQLLRSKPQVLCGPHLGQHYRQVAKKVIGKYLRASLRKARTAKRHPNSPG